MTQQFKISSGMTKKEIIDKYTALLNAYKGAVQEAKEAEKWRSEAEKQKEAMAIKETREATVESVTENIGKLKGQIKDTLNNLSERLTSKAERLEQINLAISAQKKRLKELYELEEFHDAFSKLTTAYEERRAASEQEYETRLKELEAEYTLRKETLTKEIEETKAAWEEEKKKFEKDFKEQKALTKEQWQREQEEYIYERDRKRRLEENEYKEKMDALEKELLLKKETAEKELEEREAAIRAKETEYQELRRKVEEFPAILQKEIEKAKKQTASEIKTEMNHQIKIMTTEHEWEKKVDEQKIAFLEETVKSQEAKILGLKAEVAQALEHVREIAEKAVEGASHVKAFQSVKEIAMEQAKKNSLSKEE